MNATTTVLQTDSLLFRPTLPDDLERICTIIRQAQAQMRLGEVANGRTATRRRHI